MTKTHRPALSTHHAVAVIVRDAGILVRGRSGAGKSRLAEELAAEARARGWFGRLVADDRVQIVARAGRAILSPHPTIAGQVERRGQGIFVVDHEDAAVLRLVVDLVDRAQGGDDAPRFPDESARSAEIVGVVAPRIALIIGEPGGARLLVEKIAAAGA